MSDVHPADIMVSVSSATAAASTLHHRRVSSSLTGVSSVRSPTSPSSLCSHNHPTATISNATTRDIDGSYTDHEDVSAESVVMARSKAVQIFTLADLHNDLEEPEVASISKLSTWDYPVFDLADCAPSTALSQVGIVQIGDGVIFIDGE